MIDNKQLMHFKNQVEYSCNFIKDLHLLKIGRFLLYWQHTSGISKYTTHVCPCFFYIYCCNIRIAHNVNYKQGTHHTHLTQQFTHHTHYITQSISHTNNPTYTSKHYTYTPFRTLHIHTIQNITHTHHSEQTIRTLCTKHKI